MKRERNSVIFTLHETSCNILFSKLKIHGLQMAYHEDDDGSRTLRAFPRFSFFSSSHLKTKLKLLLCFIITNNGRKLSINTWMELYNGSLPLWTKTFRQHQLTEPAIVVFPSWVHRKSDQQGRVRRNLWLANKNRRSSDFPIWCWRGTTSGYCKL